MGVRGLTTYINNRSEIFLEDYKLYNTKLVLDGNCIAAHLYKWHCKSNDCFGGDYDKFANVIISFFNLLVECNITPYVIFDGGYEKRKLATVKSRMKNKIRTASQLNSVTEGSQSVFPLFLRETFIDVLLKLNIKMARSDFECDTEIANIAKMLNCPVLSYDSDYYIFGCLYIPFSTMDLYVRKSKDKMFNYISCKIYKVEKFLSTFGGLDKKNLPILAVVLGNDYIKRSIFEPFFKNLKIQKGHNAQNDQQKRIKSVIVWLQNETLESGITKILSRFKADRRKLVMRKIKIAMSCYYSVNVELLYHLGIAEPSSETKINVNFGEIENNLTDISEDDLEILEESDMEESDEFSLEGEYETKKHISLSKVFKDNFRKCLYPSCFMDMVVLNKYYCVPQVEVSNLEHAHTISLKLISIIHKILTNTDKDLTLLARCGEVNIKYYPLRNCTMNVPSCTEIKHFNHLKRKEHFLSLLQLEQKFINSLNLFPWEWHLFLISLKYAFSHGSFDISLLYSFILCFMVLTYVDNKIGFYRSIKMLQKKFCLGLQCCISSRKNAQSIFQNISQQDCLNCMQKLILYFKMDEKVKNNYKLFDRNLVHSMSEIQSCFLHIKYLNSLFNYPYPNLTMHTVFDGTFIYNMTTNLRKRSNLESYIKMLLMDAPTIANEFEYVLTTISEYFICQSITQKKKHKRKRKKLSQTALEEDDCDIEQEHANIVDPNNLFSVLSLVSN
ncbi:protein asteroid [Cylas formicarius]|uniref:protein asteroid n=1 Tax=Cylas formicarius TaxID=197179 RepID=UPI002958A62D|nr:protein asteroid [Cylas formicarius]